MDLRYNELPPRWNVTPHALMGLVGAQKFHGAMRKSLMHEWRTGDRTAAGNLKSLEVVSLENDFQIPPKATAPTGVKRFKFPIPGLLKTDWMDKWYTKIPGTILLMVELRRAGRTWDEQELSICQQVEKLRTKTFERRINIAVIIVQESFEAVKEEHLASLRKRGNLEVKQVYKLTIREIEKLGSAMVSKTWKNTQDMLAGFYQSAIRKYMKHIKTAKTCAPLRARHIFKIAYFYEVLGETHKAQKEYEHALDLATTIHTSDSFDIEQVKVFASLCMWRVYSRTLKDKKAVDAHRSKMFHRFLHHFRKRVGSCRYRHFGWLAQQCFVYAGHLDGFDEAVSTLEKPVHFRNLAVQYAVEQRKAAQEEGVYQSDVMPADIDEAAAVQETYTIQPPKFVGGIPTVVDKKTGEPLESSGEGGAFHALERLVNHSANIMEVLEGCIAIEEKIVQAKSKPTSPRKKRSSKASAGNRSLARKKYVMAEECFQSGEVQEALDILQDILGIYADYSWPTLARQVLQRMQETALRCAKSSVFVDASLRLLSQFPDSRQVTLAKQVITSLATHRSNSGSPLQIAIHPVFTRKLFSVECTFDRIEASQNDAVKACVTITSHFPTELVTQIPHLHFNDSRYDVQASMDGDTVTLAPSAPTKFERDIVVVDGESGYLCLKSISTSIVDTAKVELAKLTVPVDDDGSTSRAATTALAELVNPAASTSSSAASSSWTSKTREQQRHHWLAIVPAVASAAVKVAGDSTTLYGATHELKFTISSNDDHCSQSHLELTFAQFNGATEDVQVWVFGEPSVTQALSPESNTSSKDADVAIPASENSPDLLKIDPETGACESVPLPDVATAHTCIAVVRVRSTIVRDFKLTAVLKYTNAKNCSVASSPTKFTWKCVNPLEVRQTVDYVEPNVW